MTEERLSELNDKIKNGVASPADEKEYMTFLFNNGNITEKQYDNYMSGKNKEDMLKGALLVGGALLVAWIIKRLLGE